MGYLKQFFALMYLWIESEPKAIAYFFQNQTNKEVTIRLFRLLVAVMKRCADVDFFIPPSSPALQPICHTRSAQLIPARFTQAMARSSGACFAADSRPDPHLLHLPHA
jgi:hypothetical protein